MEEPVEDDLAAPSMHKASSELAGKTAPLEVAAGKAEAIRLQMFPDDAAGQGGRGGSRYREARKEPRERRVAEPMREIHRTFAIKKTAFDRVFKDVVDELIKKDEAVLGEGASSVVKATPGARVVLHYALEEFSSGLMSDALLFAKHAKRKESITQKDLRLARGVRGRLLEQHREDQEYKYKTDKGKSKFYV